MPVARPSSRRSLSARRRLRRIVAAAATATATLLAVFVVPSSTAASAASGSLTTQEWHSTMQQLPTPSKGCFTAQYPSLTWHSTACTQAPQVPYLPKTPAAQGKAGPQLPASAVAPAGTSGTVPTPYLVGGGIDYSAAVTGLLTGATGSFPTVTNVTSVDTLGVPNSYSLQLNSSPFNTPACGGNPGCQGWEQFLFTNVGSAAPPGAATAFIQFWLLNYGAACPPGWTTSGFNCYTNGNSITVPPQAISELANLQLSGEAASGQDKVIMETGVGTPLAAMYAAPSPSLLGLSTGWNVAEFLIAGNGNGTTAHFNSNAAITVQTVTHNGTTSAPMCLMTGYSAESNDLFLVGTPAYPVGSSPSIRSTQRNYALTPPSCAAAQGTGDTHLVTFGGTYYDFQAEGTFTLARTSSMTVQNNQVSGASLGWPNAAVNSGVATQMGKDTVAVCAKRGLVVNGSGTALGDGASITLPSGDRVVRTGNQYVVTDPQGDSMAATINPGYVDVHVGLGTYPQPVVGLLANAPGTNDKLRTNTGLVLGIPLDFKTLYGVYGDGWRVPADQSLVRVCGDKPQGAKAQAAAPQATDPEAGDPQAPFWEEQLPKELREQARTTCIDAGVKDVTLLEACTLDVGVLGPKAAREFVGEAPPANVAFSEDTDN